jgi:LuxR family maltose regulon positive regulatory protein
MQLGSSPVGDAVMIRTKVQAPRLPTYAVERPRLTATFAEAAGCPLVLVLGPPGSGKTVAVQQWLQTDPGDRRVAWLTVEQSDDASLRFWDYVVMALEETCAGDFAETRAIVAEAGASNTDVVASLVNEATRARPVCLVLDDLHNLRAPDVLDALAMLIEHAPSQLSIVATARAEPPFPLAYWRGASIVREIRQADLAFTVDEASGLLECLGCRELSPHDLELLTARTEGWAAALQLFAVSARHDVGVSGVLADVLSGRNEAIAAFLAAEVLNRQPPDIRQFLLETSILDTLDAATCDAVTGRRDARAVLGQLERDNLFLIRVNSRGSFRYHQLFRDLIRLELAASEDPAIRHALHRRAGQHLAKVGDVAGAVQHLIGANDIDAAFEVAVAPALAQWDRGQSDLQARQTLDLLPVEFVQHDARRMLTYIVALAATSDWTAVRRWLEIADGVPSITEDADLGTDLAVLWTTLHLINGDSRAMLAAGERAASAPDARGRVLPERLTANMARAHLLEDDPWTARSVLEGLRPHEPVVGQIVLPAVSARVAARLGNLSDALTFAEDALDGARALGVPNHPATSDALLARAGALLERGDLSKAEQMLQVLLDAAERRRSHGFQVLALLQQARIAAMRDPLKLDARAIVDIARRSIHPLQLTGGVAAWIDAAEARLCREFGEEEPARALAEAVPGSSGVLLRTDIELTFGRVQRAHDLLESVSVRCRNDEIASLLLRARAQHRVGEDPGASIDRALQAAATEEILLPFLEAGPVVADLSAQRACESRSSTIRLLGDRIIARSVRADIIPIVEPLTNRELEVLRYLPRHLTHEEIARDLCVSLNTLKTHLRSLYRKLGATSRFEAVVHARDAHLL